MHQGQINVRYAKALFQLSIEKKIENEVRNDINLFLDTFQSDENFLMLIEHPVLKASKKKQILGELFKDKIHESTLALLDLIVKNRREKHLKEICLNFIDLYDKHKGIKKAVLTTAYSMNRTQENKVKKAIEDTFKTKIDLKTKVEESIIGGMIIQVEDKQLDVSVSRQIQKLRNDFTKIDFNNRKK